MDEPFACKKFYVRFGHERHLFTVGKVFSEVCLQKRIEDTFRLEGEQLHYLLRESVSEARIPLDKGFYDNVVQEETLTIRNALPLYFLSLSFLFSVRSQSLGSFLKSDFSPPLPCRPSKL